jgi:Ca-activated chloride channel family protein
MAVITGCTGIQSYANIQFTTTGADMSGFSWELLQLREPLWLLLALQPVLLSLFVSLQFRRQNRVYADPELLPWVVAVSVQKTSGHLLIRFLVMQLFWLLVAIAMAGPRYPDPLQMSDRAGAADVMVVVDVSRSMTAADVRPDRLKRVKTELIHFLAQNSSARIGIILFAGHAHLLVPLTWDHDALRFYAQGIQAGLLPTEGSNLAEAIRLANQHLSDSARPAILVLTDGESHEQITQSSALLQTPLYIMGVGSVTGTTIAATEGGWLMHDNRPVRTRLHSKQLQTLASSSGGDYADMSDELGSLNVLYQQAADTRAGRKAAATTDQAWVELYPWLLLPALLLLLLMALSVQLTVARFAQAGILLLSLSAGLLHNSDASAQVLTADKEKQAYIAYTDNNFSEAMAIYAIHTGFNARMGEGSSAYQLKDHARAISQFTQAFLVAQTDKQRANALYNLGNSFFLVKNYAAALTTYEDVLRYHAQHLHAQANLEFVKSVIASLVQDPFASSARAKRAGRGPRSLLADENTRGGGDFSLDDEEQVTTRSARNGLQQGDPGLLDIIASGKEDVQVADETIQVEDAAAISPVNAVQLLQARRIVMQGKRDQSGLWKSLFEEEEGFSAPLEQPVSEPGVLPW